MARLLPGDVHADDVLRLADIPLHDVDRAGANSRTSPI